MEELINEYDKLKIEISNKLEEYLIDICSKEFTNEFTAVKFTAYTPYFNDGDSCKYEVNSIYDVKYNNEIISMYDLPDEIKVKVKNMQKGINLIPSEIFENAFGDHIEITITKDRVKIEDYDHD